MYKKTYVLKLIDCSPEESLKQLNTNLNGLNKEQIRTRRKEFGLNDITHEKVPSWYIQLIKSFITPFNAVLLVVCIVSFFTDIAFSTQKDRSFKTIIVLGIMILCSTLLRFWQEFRSNKAAEQLRSMVRSSSIVKRQEKNEPEDILTSRLVPGDIIYLSAGDIIPADLRIISSKDLFISQSMLTGESMPIEKHSSNTSKITDNLLEAENICFMGTSVVSGTAVAVVISTGNKTYFGEMSKNIVNEKPLTSFDLGINKISWMLIYFIMIMTPLIFLINALLKGNWIESLLFAASVAVGLTPEMLPMVVTSNLAKGAVNMAKRKTIVKKLSVIQNFGAMDILCTDKTGTLTQNKVILERHLNPFGQEDTLVLEYAWLNSFHQTGLRNLLDIAVLEHQDSQTIAEKMKEFHKIDEIPFDFTRRRMSVVIKNGNSNLLICKGAMEEVLACCSSIKQQDSIIKGTSEKMTEIHNFTHKLNKEGLRTIAVAYKELPIENKNYTIADEHDLTLAGYIAFLDPPKEGVSEAIAALKSHGINIKIITGDSDLITQKVCRDIGLKVEGTILGKDIEKLSDEELAIVVEKTTIFAKMSPLQKARIIISLKGNNHTVGFLGDGINDAIALKNADVGISVDTAVDIAKESADIILLEKSLMVLQEGVIEGRKIFGNIIKYITMTSSSNFGNALSVLIASIFLPFLPMLPLQLLVQNMLYDISQISIPWDNVDGDFLEQPHQWDAKNIAKFMIFIGPISSIFDIITFLVMWYIFGANSADNQALFHSGWFVVGLLTQTLIIHMIRTKHIPFIQSVASTPVILLTVIIMCIGVYIPFSNFGQHIGIISLPTEYFYWLGGILLSYCSLMQIAKHFYIKRFNKWI